MNRTHPGDIDLNLLRLFHCVYVERSVSAAAGRLGLTQSAVSHALRKLRGAFRDELFVRSGSGLVPTPRAVAMFEPIDRMMSTVAREVLPATVFDPATARREFTLAMVDMAEIVFLPPLMSLLRRSAPGCTLRTQRFPEGGLVEALDGNRVELVIGNLPEADGHVYRQNLFLHDYVVLASLSHPRLTAGALTWADYARESHVVVASGSDRNLVERTLGPRGIERRVAVTVGNFLSVPWLLRGTDLIATAPERLGQDLAAAAGLRQYALPEPAHPYPLQCAWHPRWHNDPGHRWLRDSIYHLMRDYPRVEE